MNTTRLSVFSVVGLLVTLGNSACLVEPGDTGPTGEAPGAADSVSQDIDLGIGPVQLSFQGATATWTYLGTPSSASKIAVCSGYYSPFTVYALNNDYSLYSGDGTDSKWIKLGNPSAARDIACVYGGSKTKLFALNQDKTLYTNETGKDADWRYEGTKGDALQIGSGLSAVSAGGTVSLYGGNGSWAQAATLRGATEVSAARIGYTANQRLFVVVNGDVLFSNGPGSAFNSLPLTVRRVGTPAGIIRTHEVIRDVAAPKSDTIFALTESRALYKAQFTETSCRDGVDNDTDGNADGFDSDCFRSLGTETCQKMGKSGQFCISRIGVPSPAVAICNGATLDHTYSEGGWCQQVNNGGPDLPH